MKDIPLTKEEERIANEESIVLFGHLRKKYCNDSVSDLDIILNSLCFALLRLVHAYVPPKDRQFMLRTVIIPILEKGIVKE